MTLETSDSVVVGATLLRKEGSKWSFILMNEVGKARILVCIMSTRYLQNRFDHSSAKQLIFFSKNHCH